jgi:hypothetical protein
LIACWDQSSSSYDLPMSKRAKGVAIPTLLSDQGRYS